MTTLKNPCNFSCLRRGYQQPRGAGLAPVATPAHPSNGSSGMEPGLVSLVKIVCTLVFSMSVVPMLFLLLGGGERAEPKEDFDSIR